MISSPSITVLMPTYNCRRYIVRAIDSVLAQTYGEFELLVIDDGSTDGTHELVATYRDPRIHRIYHRQRLGVPACLNAALRRTSSNYVAIVAANSECLPDRLKHQIEFLQSRPDIGILGTSYLEVWHGGDIGAGLEKLHETYPAQGGHLFREFRGTVGMLLCLPPRYIHSTIMIQRSAISRPLKYDERFLAAYDYKLFVDHAPYTRFANLSDYLVNYYKIPIVEPEARDRTDEENVIRSTFFRSSAKSVHQKALGKVNWLFDTDFSVAISVRDLAALYAMTKDVLPEFSRKELNSVFKRAIRNRPASIHLNFSWPGFRVIGLLVLRYKMKRWFRMFFLGS